MNFEAGFGDGAGARVVPVSIRGFSPGKLDFPLLGYQGRSIDDLPSILADVTKAVGLPSKSPVLADYLNEIREAEAQMAYKTIEVSPFVMADQLQFRIRNTSNSDIELLMLEAWVPRRYVYPAQGNPLATFGGATAGGFVHGEFTKRDGGDYLWFACTSQRGIFGGKPPGLRPVLTPTMGAIIPKMQIRLEPNQPQGASPDQPIYYQIHAVDHPTEQKKIMWAELLAGT